MAETNERNVSVTIMPLKNYDVVLDVDKLRWQHMGIFQKATAEGISEGEAGEAFFSLLEVLTGQDMRDYPLRVITRVMAEMQAAMGEMANPKN